MWVWGGPGKAFFFKLASQIQLLVNFQNLAFRVDAAAHQRLPNEVSDKPFYVNFAPSSGFW